MGEASTSSPRRRSMRPGRRSDVQRRSRSAECPGRHSIAGQPAAPGRLAVPGRGFLSSSGRLAPPTLNRIRRPMGPANRTDGLQERNRELRILNQIATALNRSVNLGEALHTALSHTTELLGLRTGWVWLLDEADGSPFLAATKNLPPGLAAPRSRMEGRCFCLDAFQSGRLRGARNVGIVACSRLRWLTEGTEGLSCHASVPLETPGAKLGVLNLAGPEWKELSEPDLAILRTVGEMVSNAVERARLFRKSAEAGMLRERNRLAREIHDTLAQGLAASAFHLDAAQSMMSTGDPDGRAHELVARALETTRANLEDARRSVLDLRSAPLDGDDLPTALRTLVPRWLRGAAGSSGEFRRTPDSEVSIRIHIMEGVGKIPPNVEAAFLRVAQEGVTNAVRHADPREIIIELTRKSGDLLLRIEDDGGGFEPEDLPAGRFGLVGMRERIQLLGGTFRIRTSPGHGTTLEARVPESPPRSEIWG